MIALLDDDGTLIGYYMRSMSTGMQKKVRSMVLLEGEIKYEEFVFCWRNNGNW